MEKVKTSAIIKSSADEIGIMLLSAKYAPKKLDDIVGNPEKITQIRQWILQWKNNKKRKALLVHGSPGTGKTSVAYALENEFDLDLIELNASELRNKSRIEKITGGASLAGTLFGTMRIVLIDDVDVLAGNSDRGGGAAITAFLRDCPCPIVVTATDVWDKGLSSIRNECELVEFKRINRISLRKILEVVAKEEKLNISEEKLSAIAESAAGDVRAAINNLQANSSNPRDRDKDIFDLVRRIFKAESYSEVKDALRGEMDYDTLKLWIDENIPYEYDDKIDVAAAYDSLSRADIFDGRIKKSQWQLLKYSIDLATAGVALSKKAVYKKFTKYCFPSYLRSMSRTVASRAMRKAVGLKLGKYLHLSWRRSVDFFPLIKELAKKNPEHVMLYYEFSEDELAYLLETSVSRVQKTQE